MAARIAARGAGRGCTTSISVIHLIKASSDEAPREGFEVIFYITVSRQVKYMPSDHVRRRSRLVCLMVMIVCSAFPWEYHRQWICCSMLREHHHLNRTWPPLSLVVKLVISQVLVSCAPSRSLEITNCLAPLPRGGGPGLRHFTFPSWQSLDPGGDRCSNTTHHDVNPHRQLPYVISDSCLFAYPLRLLFSARQRTQDVRPETRVRSGDMDAALII